MDVKELQALATQEMAKHGLTDWTFALATTRRRLGVCKYRSKRIEIAEFHAANNPPPIVLDTLLHEIAHAIAGPAAGHGPKWKVVAMRLGATPNACDDSRETIAPPGDWQAACAACSRIYHRYKRPMSLTGYRCKCSARSPLTFEWMGDPARKPAVPMTPADSAKWEAACAGCQTLHLRRQRPKRGVWRCKCPSGCVLTWRFRRR